MSPFLLSILIIAVVYLIPSVVAFKRNHPKKVAILLLNIILGFTLIGWLAAFIWSFMDTTNKSAIGHTGDELQKLAALKEQGHLTDDEFNRKKQQLLNM